MAELPVIAIIGGTGNEGRGLAIRWANAGYRVIIGSRDAEKAKAAAAAISGKAEGSFNVDAARAANIVVMTVPYAAQEETIGQVKEVLEGKILVDVTVPLVPPKVSTVQLPPTDSAVVTTQIRLGSGVKVVSAFQNVSSDLLADLRAEVECDVLVCGDDPDAREEVVKLTRAAGMRAWHAGPLANSAATEALTSVLIFINRKYKSSHAGLKITGIGSRHNRVEFLTLPDFPIVQEGDDLAGLICRYPLETGDIVVVAQKVVSKSEGRFAALENIVPSEKAVELGRTTGKDVRLIELILRESTRVVHAGPELLIVEHLLGFVTANAGIDQSNVGRPDHVLLLPKDPDRSALQLKESILRHSGQNVGVVINDSWGRPWRLGTVGVALGVAGVSTVVNRCGERDLFGQELYATWVAVADEVASAASLLMGQAAEATPVVVIRGLSLNNSESKATDIVRPASQDVFRRSSTD